MKRKLLSLILAVLLFLGMLPMNALTAEAGLIDLSKYLKSDDSWEDNILCKDFASKTGGKVFGTSTKRSLIETITFLDTLKDAPGSSWDVSEDKDGSVMAWLKKDGSKYHLFIAGDGGVSAPENCSGMFCGYTEVEEIHFGGNFHTENATTMSYMFSHCEELEELDLYDFDTSNVERMECMFMHCYDLETLDINHFDISNVVDMGSMFWGNTNMETLYMPELNYRKGFNTAYMFEKCTKLNVIYGESAPNSPVSHSAPVSPTSPAPTTPAPTAAPTAPPSVDVDGIYSLKRGKSMEIKGHERKWASDYHVWEWTILDGASRVELTDESSQTCTVKAKKSGDALIQVEYSYTTDGYDILTGNPRKIHHTSQKVFMIQIP